MARSSELRECSSKEEFPPAEEGTFLLLTFVGVLFTPTPILPIADDLCTVPLLKTRRESKAHGELSGTSLKSSRTICFQERGADVYNRDGQFLQIIW